MKRKISYWLIIYVTCAYVCIYVVNIGWGHGWEDFGPFGALFETENRKTETHFMFFKTRNEFLKIYLVFSNPQRKSKFVMNPMFDAFYWILWHIENFLLSFKLVLFLPISYSFYEKDDLIYHRSHCVAVLLNILGKWRHLSADKKD